MATLPVQIRPGDIISADLMNAVLAELALLKGSGIGGTQLVPNVFGTFLSDARTIITQPTLQLSLGFTFDVNGAAVDPLVPANQSLIVLNQSPVADARVAPNTPVNLVVSASGSGAPQPTPAPTIGGTETAGGAAANAFAVGTTLAIVGTNFSATASQNTVRFNAQTAPSTPDPADPTRRLLVVVPTGIPGAPVNAGDPSLPNVTLSVTRTGNATSATATITINAPSATQPTIANVSPGTQFETQNITINGTNFSASVQVFIQGVQATLVTSSPTQIIATVPDLGLLQGPSIAVSLRVSNPPGGNVNEANFTGLRVIAAP
jgi:hypothetical protein